MDEMDMRNDILQELIGKMHDRLADKEYPEEKPPVEETVAVALEPKAEESAEPKDEDISDEELAALEKGE